MAYNATLTEDGFYEKAMRAAMRPFRKPVEVDEFKLRKAMERAARARQLLENEELKAAFEVVESVYLGVWRNTDAMDQERRERCYNMVTALADVKKYLIAAVENGDAAARELKKIAED
jgi:hypothetical protein